MNGTIVRVIDETNGYINRIGMITGMVPDTAGIKVRMLSDGYEVVFKGTQLFQHDCRGSIKFAWLEICSFE